MLKQLGNFARSLLGSIPIVGNLVRKNPNANDDIRQTKVNREAIHKGQRISELGFSSPFKDQRLTKRKNEKFLLGLRELTTGFPIRSLRPDSDYDSLAQLVKQKIKRTDETTNAEINFNTSQISTEVSFLQNHISNNFKQRLLAINSESLDPDLVTKYAVTFRQYLIENIRLCLELQNLIVNSVLDLPGDACGRDFAQAFVACKDISKIVMNHALQEHLSAFSILPSVSFAADKNEVSLRSLVADELKDYVREVYLASKLGVNDKSLVSLVMKNLAELDFKDDQQLHESLLSLSIFHSAVHGSVLHDSRNVNEFGHELAEIDEQIPRTCLAKLLDLIEAEHQMQETLSVSAKTDAERIEQQKKSEELESVNCSIANIQNFLKQISHVEIEAFLEGKKNLGAEFLTRLGLDSNNEIPIIEGAYKALCKTGIYLGQIVEKDLLGEHFESPVIQILNSEQAFKKHFIRVVLETKALAAIDAISTAKGRKDQDDLCFLEKNQNFKTLPWLKDFYFKSLQRYQEMIRVDKSIEKTMNVAKELSKLGHHLHKIELFQSDNFFKRYGIEYFAESMLQRMGELTEIGVISIMIDLYSNFFSYLSAKDEDLQLSDNEISRLKRLIRFLREVSTIRDLETGEVIYNPPRDNSKTSQYAKNTYDRVMGVFNQRSFLLLNTDLILKFFNKAIEAEKIKKAQNPNYSLLDAKHGILATWLLYLLVKFLPRKSDDVESLRSRIKVLKDLLNDHLQSSNKEIPDTLYKRISNQIMGYQDKGADQGSRLGIVTEVCDEIDQYIQDHIQGRETSIGLKELLYCYKELEEHFAANPKGAKKALRERKNVYNNLKPLLVGLKKVCAQALSADTDLIVKFAKESNDQGVRLSVANELLERIVGLITKSKQLSQDSITILDSSQEPISELIKILSYVQYLGFLMNSLGSKITYLSPKDFIELGETQDEHSKQKFAEVQGKVSQLQKFLTKKITLVQDEKYIAEEEVFPNQAKLKDSLRHLLSKVSFGIKPGLGKTFDWLSKNEVEKLQERQTEYGFAV